MLLKYVSSCWKFTIVPGAACCGRHDATQVCMVDGRGVGGKPARVRGGVGGGAGVAALGLPGVGGGDMGVVGGGAGERAARGKGGRRLRAPRC